MVCLAMIRINSGHWRWRDHTKSMRSCSSSSFGILKPNEHEFALRVFGLVKTIPVIALGIV